ncbi:transglutaminase family protein [Microbacterium aureliae]
MSQADPRPRRRGIRSLTIGVVAAVLASLMPMLRVIAPGPWVIGTLAMIGMLLAAGFVARRYRLPALAVTLIEGGLWAAFLCLVFLREESLFGFIPTADAVRAVPAIIDGAMTDIVEGIAPMTASTGLTFLLIGAAGLLTIVVDHVVLTARMPLVAAIALIVVSLIPAIAVPVEPDISAFLLVAAAVLFLVRAETRAREPVAPAASPREAGRPTGATATALGIGAVAVVVALVVTPSLPQPVLRAGSGEFGTGIGLDASLQLGSDLRRPREIEVMLVRSDAPAPPYLRATTLSTFDGAVWEPDRAESTSLEGSRPFGPLETSGEVAVAEYTTTVEVKNLSSAWLPVPYPATEVSGLVGDWSSVPYNRTVVARGATSQGQNYQVTSTVPRPTLEQIRATEAGGAGLEEARQLPPGLPAIIRELAREVTAEATNDYDRVFALQEWFRGADFRYSLFAPVEEGFDGTGADAIARFLEVREGYCVHFASAFALMARTLGMPARIVVGYLPGAPTTDAVDRQTVHSVTTSRTHAWPEVHFEGIGWIGFEPTNSLGSPTAFAAARDETGQTPADRADGETATPTPTPRATADVPGAQERDQGSAAGPDAGRGTGLPPLLVVTALLALLAAPGVARVVRRRRQLTEAERGDALAAWSVAQEAAIDVGVSVPGAESPRAFGARLVAEHGAPADAVERLVLAVEQASYAPVRGREWLGDGIAEAAVAVRTALLADADPARRVLAVVAPRSLIVRPGTTFATTARA